MLLYFCADVSLFEYFEGNNSLGILSYRQVIKPTLPPPDPLHLTASNAAEASAPCPHSDTDNLLFDDYDCFCCSAHALFSTAKFSVTLLPLAEPVREANYAEKPRQSELHTPKLYRPPRLS